MCNTQHCATCSKWHKKIRAYVCPLTLCIHMHVFYWCKQDDKMISHNYTCFASTAAVYSLPNASSVMATSSRMMLKSRARSVSSLRTSRLTCCRWVINCDALNLATTLFNTYTCAKTAFTWTVHVKYCTQQNSKQSDSQTYASTNYVQFLGQAIIQPSDDIK